MTSKTTVAEPRAVLKVSNSGRALPREKLPIITAKKTCAEGGVVKDEWGGGGGVRLPIYSPLQHLQLPTHKQGCE